MRRRPCGGERWRWHISRAGRGAAWDQPSLCQGWSVRDVGAHLAFSHARVRDVLWPAVRTGFRYNATIKYSAVHSTLAHEQIVAILRGFVGSRRKAPIVTELEPLLDILVHTQDICIPLGIEYRAPDAGPRGRRGRGPGARALRADAAVVAAKGIRLVATEADSIEIGDVLALSAIHDTLGEETMTLRNTTQGVEYAVRHRLSPRQVHILLAGGLIPWVREHRN